MKKTKPQTKAGITVSHTFEDCIDIINIEVAKRRSKWLLSSIPHIDYEDVSQILRIHIFNKWYLYNQSKPLIPWLNIIISNQIKNLIRNLYSNYSRPCLKCYAATDNTSCKIYGEQCIECPLFANWKLRKEPASNVKMPLPIENHEAEVKDIFDTSCNIFEHIKVAHKVMKDVLKPFEYEVYRLLYINEEDENRVAKKLGFISNEKGRLPGYKHIQHIKKIIITKFKKALVDGLIDIF